MKRLRRWRLLDGKEIIDELKQIEDGLKTGAVLYAQKKANKLRKELEGEEGE